MPPPPPGKAELGLRLGIFLSILNPTIAQSVTDPDSLIERSQKKFISEKPQLNPRPKRQINAKFLLIQNADNILHREEQVGGEIFMESTAWKHIGVDMTQINGIAPWLHFSGFRAFTNANYEYNSALRFNLGAGLGWLTLNRFQNINYDTRATIPLWRFRGIYMPAEGTELRIEQNQDFSYVGWVDEFGSHIHRQQSIFAEIETFSLNRWQLRVNARWSRISDQNQLRAFDHLVLYQFLENLLEIKIGLGGGSLMFARQRPEYWSPRRFENYGIRFVVAKRVSKQLFFEARIARGKRRVQGEPLEWDTFGEFLLDFQSKAGWMVAILASYYEVNRGAWWRSDVTAHLRIPI